MCIDYDPFREEEERILGRLESTKKIDHLRFKIENLVKLQLNWEIALISSILIFIGLISLDKSYILDFFDSLVGRNVIFYGIFIITLIAFDLGILFFFGRVLWIKKDVKRYYKRYLKELGRKKYVKRR